MVYLIESSGCEKKIDGTFDYFMLLKIGYTNTNNCKSRLNTYLITNPTSSVLYIIPELDCEDERRIQSYFKKYLYNSIKYKGVEWFNYSDEIIDFFKDLSKKSVEEVRKVIDSLPSTKYKSNKTFKRIRGISYNKSVEIRNNLTSMSEQILSSNLKNKEEVINLQLDLIKNKIYDHTSKEYLDYISFNYGKDVLDDYNNRYNKLSSILKNKLEYFYRKKTVIIDKYKLLCEDIDKNFNPEEIKLFLSFIPDYNEIKSNYLLLGPKFLIGVCYNKTRITEGLSKLVSDKDLLVEKILSEYSIGETIPSKVLKDKLIEIYRSLGSTRVVSASVILNYFNAKEYPIRTDIDGSGTKKVIRVYTLLSIKPEYEELYNKIKGI